MNLKVTIPKNWTPECDKAINNWFNKISEEAKKTRFNCKIKQ